MHIRTGTLVAVLASVIAGASCGSSTRHGDIQVTVLVAPTTIRAGESVTIILTATNTGTRSRQINTSTCPRLPFVVTTLDGKVAGPGGSRLCTPIGNFKDLGPGEQYVLTLRGPGEALVAPLEAPRLLAPGTYAVRGEVGYEGGVAKSQPVVLHIVPDDSQD